MHRIVPPARLAAWAVSPVWWLCPGTIKLERRMRVAQGSGQEAGSSDAWLQGNETGLNLEHGTGRQEPGVDWLDWLDWLVRLGLTGSNWV